MILFQVKLAISERSYNLASKVLQNQDVIKAKHYWLDFQRRGNANL